MSPHPLSRFEAGLLRNEVFKLIKAKSFAKGNFVLASGAESNYYLDMKPTMFDPEGASKLAELILDRLQNLNLDYIGGLEMGAVPLLAPISMLSVQHRPLPSFFVRKTVKDHGTRKHIEGLAAGESLRGKTVAILDDVTTTGASAMIAVDAAQRDGAKVALVLSVVDRDEGAFGFYGQRNIPFDALFRASEFLNSD